MTEAAGLGVCYVVPAYGARQAEHFFHLPAFLHQVGKQLPLAVIVERGTKLEGVDSARHMVALGAGDLGRLRRAFRFFREARRVSQLGYRLFFLRYSRLAATVLLILRLKHRIRILYWVSGQADLRVERSLYQRVRRRLNHSYLKFLFVMVDAVVTGPEAMLQYMQERWRIPDHKLRLLYNDIDTERYRPASELERHRIRSQCGVDDEFVILFVHRMAVRRGSRMLLPVAEGVASKLGSGFRLLVVGGGPDQSFVQESALESPVDHLVEFRGVVPNSDLPRLYQAADCFLMPSYEEGFPRVLLEAMASALPVVSTRAGGAEDVLGSDYPFLVDPGDVRGMVNHLVAVARDEQLRHSHGKALRIRAMRRFRTEEVANMFVRLVSDEA